MDDILKAALDAYVAMLDETAAAHCKRMGHVLPPPTHSWEAGNTYARVWRCDRGGGKSAQAFVALADVRNRTITASRGDILKPDGWKSPARGVRGSIFADRGRAAVGDTGLVNYAR